MKIEESEALQMQEKMNINIAAHNHVNPTLEIYQFHIDSLKMVNEQRAKEGLERLTMPNIVKTYIELLIRFTFDKERKNERENTIHETFFSLERYYFDTRLCPQGFKQFDTDQDAPYFGIWVNKDLLCTFIYCEGDIYLCICNDVEHYNAEIQACIECYDEGYIAIAIDPDKGEQTIYQQDRNEFLIEQSNN